MRIFGCGCNIHNELLQDIECMIICCPTQVVFEKLVDEVQITVPYILWNDGVSWNRTGYTPDDYKELHDMKANAIVRIAENRVAVANDEAVFLYSQSRWKKLTLQYHHRIKPWKNTSTDKKIIDLALQDNVLLIVNKAGNLLNGGIEIPLTEKILKVAAGKEHCLALTESWGVLAWGSGMRGQLGNGSITTYENPVPVTSLDGISVKTIIVGGWHSMALSRDGDVYAWGWNESGQLGFRSAVLRSNGIKYNSLGSIYVCKCETKSDESCDKFLNEERCLERINVQATPKLVDYWNLDINIVEVACGDRHTIFLLDNGTVWTTGWNKYGQLGLHNTNSIDEPKRVDLSNIKKIYAGGWNSVFTE